MQKKPGLSFYAKDPQESANSLFSLLEKAENVIPNELRGSTPVRVGVIHIYYFTFNWRLKMFIF